MPVPTPAPNIQKPLEWAGAARKDLLAFPDVARRNVGYALGLAQRGGKHPDAKHRQGEGVFEFVESFEGNAYRAVYSVRFAQAVYVLHCFQKKAPSGIRTAQTDIDLIRHRLRAAAQHYEAHYGKKD